MILGDDKTATATVDGEITLDAIFRRTVTRRPDAVALADPPNREAFTDGAPRRLTYAQADRIVSAIAARLRRLGLDTDSVVALQLPNIVESVLTVLGILRAGMIAAPLPLLWRRADLVAALGRIGAKAIVTTSRIGEIDHGELATQAAAELFPVRHVCGFGSRLKDGMIAFEDLLNAEPDRLLSPPDRGGDSALHVAVVTFEVTPAGLVAVARNHQELLAGGLVTLLEAGIARHAAILGCCTLSTFAGLAVTLLPWLLSGGSLGLHQPFDAAVFAMQCRRDNGVTVILPGALAPRLANAGLLRRSELSNIVAMWPSPERLRASPPWAAGGASLVDMLVFGEIALCGARRGDDGMPQRLPAGNLRSPRGSAGGVIVLELARSDAGTLALRGPMVPRHPFPPGAERASAPHLRANAQGFVDTGYACRFDRDGTVVVNGPPAGLITVGGCRFALRDLTEAVRRAGCDAGIAALPDAVGGHRLAGRAADPATVRAALEADGVNALLVDAFRDRGPRDAA